MLVSALTTKYQATIPRQVREVLSLGAGDRVEFLVERGGAVRIRKAVLPDAELQALAATLAPEWNSADDDRGYDDL